jgi:acetyl esterase
MVLDPQSAAALAGMQALGIDGLAQLGLDRAREIVDANATFFRGPEIESTEDRLIGDLHTPVRVYRPSDAEGAAVVFFHGGGWALGSLDSHDALCRHLAVEANVTVVAVDYRLAPEHPFPAAVDDAWAVTHAILRDQSGLEVDPARIALAGDSAGGNLAAVTAHAARDAGYAIAAQVLVYPVIDRRLDRPSMVQCATGFGLEASDMAWFWDLYDASGVAVGDPRAEPSSGPLEGLAPALIITAEHDPLRDEGEEYAAGLQAAGVPVTLRRHEGTFHGFAAAPGFLDAGDRALQQIVAALRTELHR